MQGGVPQQTPPSEPTCCSLRSPEGLTAELGRSMASMPSRYSDIHVQHLPASSGTSTAYVERFLSSLTAFDTDTSCSACLSIVVKDIVYFFREDREVKKLITTHALINGGGCCFALHGAPGDSQGSEKCRPRQEGMRSAFSSSAGIIRRN